MALLPAGGSPPRGRGGRIPRVPDRAGRRLTPAWAGRTTTSRPCSPKTRAHPRVGGADHARSARESLIDGSPPRGRGGQHDRAQPTVGKRLTPAWAGRTGRSRCSVAFARAHPRVGGADQPFVHLRMEQQGSPPRGRGGPRSTSRSRPARWLTPAWAGRTTGGSPTPACQAAHPRVGGADKYSNGRGHDRAGSPPRGRGGHLVTSANELRAAAIQSLSAGSQAPLAGIAPAGSSHCLGFIRASDERQAVEVAWRPVVAIDIEAQSLLSSSAEYHQGTSFFAQLDDSSPQFISNPRAHLANEHPRADLQQPARDVAAQPDGAGRQNEHYHGGSSS